MEELSPEQQEAADAVTAVRDALTTQIEASVPAGTWRRDALVGITHATSLALYQIGQGETSS